jgi:hypothetical protein
MYNDAVRRLHGAAERVAEYGRDLATFGDTLAARGWDAVVAGEVADVAALLSTLYGTYCDLAAEMKRQGDVGAAAHECARWVPDGLIGGVSSAADGAAVGRVPEPVDDEDLDEDEQPLPEEPPITDCIGCERALDEPVTDEDEAYHSECDPGRPPQYAYGEAGRSGGFKRGGYVEDFRRLDSLAEHVVDELSRCELEYGDMRVKVANGVFEDAREWAQRPETVALADMTLIPARPVDLRATCGSCGAALSGRAEVRGNTGDTWPVEKEITCGCGVQGIVQGTVAITPAEELTLVVADEWTSCVTCAGDLAMPVGRVKAAYCANCDWQVNYCRVVSSVLSSGRSVTRWIDCRDTLDLALELVDRADRGLLIWGDLMVELPSWARTTKPLDAHSWATSAKVQAVARANAARRPIPVKIEEALANGKLHWREWRLEGRVRHPDEAVR